MALYDKESVKVSSKFPSSVSGELELKSRTDGQHDQNIHPYFQAGSNKIGNWM